MSSSLQPHGLQSLSVEFSRQEYWSGLPFPSPGDIPDPGVEPGSPALQADSLPSEPPMKPLNIIKVINDGLTANIIFNGEKLKVFL